MAQARRGQGTVTETLQLSNASTSEPAQAQTINLRLAPRLKKKVTWQADTVDNEHMQKKKSKKCCIFEKAGGSDEDEDEDEDEDDDDGGKGKGKEHHHHRDCNHGTMTTQTMVQLLVVHNPSIEGLGSAFSFFV